MWPCWTVSYANSSSGFLPAHINGSLYCHRALIRMVILSPINPINSVLNLSNVINRMSFSECSQNSLWKTKWYQNHQPSETANSFITVLVQHSHSYEHCKVWWPLNEHQQTKIGLCDCHSWQNQSNYSVSPNAMIYMTSHRRTLCRELFTAI